MAEPSSAMEANDLGGDVMKARCQKFREAFFALDRGQWLPVPCLVHLLTCDECKRQVRNLVVFERRCFKQGMRKPPLESKAVMTVMNSIDSDYEEGVFAKKKAPVHRWLLAGLALVFCAAEFYPLQQLSGSAVFQAFFAVFFAVGIICYCAFFVVSNMDTLKDKLKNSIGGALSA